MNGFCKKCNEYTFVDIVNGFCINCQDPDKPKTAQMWIDQDGLHLEMDEDKK